MGGIDLKEILIRNKCVPNISSHMIRLYEETELKTLVLKFGEDHILKTIFGEEKSFKYLQEHLHNIHDTEENKNELFSKMFLLNDECGVVIDSHIYLHHFNSDMISQQTALWNWGYTETRKYLGDIWWFSPEEVLDDLQNLSTVSFMCKYKGFD